MRATIVFLILLCSQVVSAGDSFQNDSHVYSLYRTGIGQSTGRVHIATFDSSSGHDFNQINCFATSELFAKKQAGTKFWCEKGRQKN